MALESIHSSFVLVSIHKATCNIAFTCMKFYETVIAKEVGNTTNIYSKNNNLLILTKMR